MALIFQSLPLNHCRIRGPNEMMWLHEHQSNLKWRKHCWKHDRNLTLLFVSCINLSKGTVLSMLNKDLMFHLFLFFCLFSGAEASMEIKATCSMYRMIYFFSLFTLHFVTLAIFWNFLECFWFPLKFFNVQIENVNEIGWMNQSSIFSLMKVLLD